MPPTPDADTDDSGTDQPGTVPSTRPDAANSSDETSMAPDTGNAEGHPGRNATEADQDATDAADSKGKTEGTSEGEPFPPRGVLTLRALRWGGVLAMLASTAAIYLLWPEGARLDWDPRTPVGSLGTTAYLIGLAVVITFGWLLSPRQSRHPGRWLGISAALILIGGLMATAITASKWWHDYQVTGFSQPTLSIIPCIPASITIALLANSILHYTQNYVPRNPIIKCDLTYWGRLQEPITDGQAGDEKKKRKTAPISISSRQRTTYLSIAILPTLLFAGLTAVPTFHRTESHTTANSGSIETPSMPTSLNSEAAWSAEFINVMDIVGGVGGPIVLSAEGISSLNPYNGTTRWSYRHPGAHYLSDDIRDEKGKLVVSPDRKYVAARMETSAILEYPDDGSLSRTVVFDALTGKIILETTNSGGALQLTDSTLLDGNTAYSLHSKSELWTLSSHDGDDSKTAPTYWGSAGHHTFILGVSYDEYSGDHYIPHTTLTVARDTDPSVTSEVTEVVVDPVYSRHYIPIIGGWIARYNTESMNSNGGASAEAIPLDSAAHDSEPRTHIPLGVTSGLNSYASIASGCIVTYPPSDVTSSEDFEASINKEGTAKVSSIFTPSTQAVSVPVHHSGIAGARIGFTSVFHEGTHMAAITIQPGDGSPETSIPLSPNTTYLPPSSFADGLKYSPHEMITEDYQPADRIVMNTPGATIIALNVTDRTDDASYLDPKPTQGNTFRIFGVTGK
jgi:hypothetical protein avisC_03311